MVLVDEGVLFEEERCEVNSFQLLNFVEFQIETLGSG